MVQKFGPTPEQRAEQLNKILNFALRSQEKIDTQSSVDLEGKFAWDDAAILANAESENTPTFDITIPTDVLNTAIEMETAPTSNPKRPRAWTLGYNPNSKTLLVIFRDNTWWQYNNVPTEMWIGIKSTQSTGKYLRESGLDKWPDMGPADMDSLSAATKEQLSYTAAIASNIQNTPLYQKVKSLMAQEGLPDISQ